ncbi:hypothetical protein FNV43_RR17685 [Rhamnella rubrinervis]|uniref:Uncharacterized protein n=1 Tax=Rhamnella rubrinervis TaxID=2594499 RepID=A0A8K0GS55_9ROSA|nr:hypothetical protein FNV43_RR17685 [Rhamnella rubrinervis]
MNSKSNIIVGVIDTGIWPESESFSDKGFGPVPKKFKGQCATARNSDGHGTHTASTIAGSVQANVSFFGMGEGIARGGAPSARIAIYKACWFNLCSDADILYAMDDAIDDGVDILSLSLGPEPPQAIYFEDAISIGGFHAFHSGIFVSPSAGNSFPKTASNVAPSILTVAASSVDRDFNTYIYLGNSKILKRSSLNPLKMETFQGLIAGSAAAVTGTTSENARDKRIVVRQGGGVGMILVDPFAKEVGFQFVISGILIGQQAAEELQDYMRSTTITPTETVLNTKPAPKVAVFSSMRPTAITPEIIKPDITAPRVNILAAWSPVATTATAEKSVNYNIISGTSMSCPHASTVAAILKSHQPSWSPAAIKSAIMTTDNTQHSIRRDPNGMQTSPFDYGSGHIRPAAAMDPGLIYEFDSHDVINFLSSIGGSPLQQKNLTGHFVNCQNPPTPAYNFNYPSIGVSNLNGSLTVYRTITYFGKGPTTYVAYVDFPPEAYIAVKPSKLKFTTIGEKISFRVDFTPIKDTNGSFVFGALIWSNGIQRVKSPVALNVVSP